MVQVVLQEESDSFVCKHSIHRLTITAVLLAAKLTDDRVYTNALYAKVVDYTKPCAVH